MKKKMIALLAGIAAVCMLYACDGQKATESEPPAQTESSETAAGSEISAENTGESAAGTEINPSQKKLSSMELYQSFLQGEGRVYGDLKKVKYRDEFEGKDLIFLPDEKGYTFRDLVQRTADVEGLNVYMFEADYSFIDCGMDGEPDLAISLSASNFEGDFCEEISYVIKNFDGRLQLCYRTTDYSEAGSYLANTQGLISSGSYVGLESEYGYGYLDAFGDYHALYSTLRTLYWLDGEDYETGSVLFALQDRVQEKLPNEVNNLEFLLFRYRETGAPKDTLLYACLYYDENGCLAEPKAELEQSLKAIYSDMGLGWATWDLLKEKIDIILEKNALPDDFIDREDWIEWTEADVSAYWAGKIVTVSSEEQLMNAIEDGAIIYLEPGVYNVTHWLKNGDRISHMNSVDEMEDPCAKGIYYSGYGSEYELYLSNFNYLKLISKEPDNPAEIVCEPRSARVLNLNACESVLLDNLVLGHTLEQGECSGDVLGFELCTDIMVQNCDIYGCGAYGIGCLNCGSIFLKDSRIHDCSDGCIWLEDTEWFSAYETTFEMCDGYNMFSLYGSSLGFSECTFRRLYGENMIQADQNSWVSFTGCLYDVQALNAINAHEGFGDYIWMY